MGYIKVTLYIWDISKLLCKGTFSVNFEGTVVKHRAHWESHLIWYKHCTKNEIYH